MKDLLLQNKHKVTLEMVPDTELEKAQVADEEARLAEVKAAMSEEDIENVISETSRLKAAQAAHDSPEQLATIPTLTLDDLSTEQLELPNEVSTTDEGVTVFTHEVPSNGILYADVGLDLTQLPASELPLVSLFSRCLLECGTDKEDEVSLSRRIGSRTGGVGTSTLAGVKHPSDDTVATGDELVRLLFVRGKVVQSKPEELFDIVSDVLLGARFDNQKRVVEMLKESKARMESSLVSSGHSYASTRLSSVHTVAGAIGEATGGTSYLPVLRELLEVPEATMKQAQKRFKELDKDGSGTLSRSDVEGLLGGTAGCDTAQATRIVESEETSRFDISSFFLVSEPWAIFFSRPVDWFQFHRPHSQVSTEGSTEARRFVRRPKKSKKSG